MADVLEPACDLDATRGAGRDVLVVDDSRTTLHLIGRRLGRLGYGTMLCSDGGEALDLIEGRRFDLVLLDMLMPGLSGIRTLRELRASLRGVDLPVLMMTARSDTGAAVEALEAGADDHMNKPLDFAVLAARIDRLLDRARLVAELRRTNAALDARIVDRAIETGELRACLAAISADRRRLEQEVARLRA